MYERMKTRSYKPNLLVVIELLDAKLPTRLLYIVNRNS